MKKFISFSFLIAIFVFVLPVNFNYGQNSNTENPPAQSTPNQSNSDAQRLSILETKLDSAEKYNDKILNTVYWSIGALATVILFILGLNLFNINRNAEGLKKELKTSLHSELLEQLRTSIKNDIDSIKRNEFSDVRSMKFEFKKAEVEKYKSKGVYSVMLSDSLGLLELANEMPNKEYEQLNCIKYIKEAVTKSTDLLESYNQTTYLELIKVLDSLADKFPIEIEAIRRIVKSKH